MLDLKKSINFPYLNWKFLLPLFLFSFLSLINELFFFLSFCVFLLIGIGLFGTKIINKLKSYKKSNKYILKFSLITLITSIIFLILEIIVIVLGSLPLSFLSMDFILNQLSDTFLGTFSLTAAFGIFFFIVFFLFAIVLEIIKVFGLIDYFKTNKFESIFKFKKHLKNIFSKNFLVVLFFIIGVFLVYFIIFILIGAMIDNLLITYFNFSIYSVFIMWFCFLFNGTFFSAVDELLKEDKTKL